MARFTAPPELTPRPYQQEAVEHWLQNQGRGIFDMATGTGKTLTSLFATESLAAALDGRLTIVVLAPYQHLVDQWVTEIESFGTTPLKAYQSRTTWTDEFSSLITEFNTNSRDIVAVVTTHATFSMDHFQRMLDRLPGERTLIIADEVHHLGSPEYRAALPDEALFRLGLSATPSRYYDERGNDALDAYFGDVAYTYDLPDAIADGYLCEYYYVPHIIELTADEQEQYLAISKAIARILDREGIDFSSLDFSQHPELQRLLIRRSRLTGAARNKLTVLDSLIEQQPDITHTLVYCGTGRIPTETAPEANGDETETDETKRQLRAVTELLGGEKRLNVHQFTYEESQADRERLLTDFEAGNLQVLVAIRCLDEGVDIPATQTAYMLASSSNPRQFIQRRGRILRQHPGKEYAVIHDFLVRPPDEVINATDDSFTAERNLVKKELRRASTFAQSARNHPDADLQNIPTTENSLLDLRKNFNLLDT